MNETLITWLVIFGVLIGALSVAAGLIWLERRLPLESFHRKG